MITLEKGKFYKDEAGAKIGPLAGDTFKWIEGRGNEGDPEWENDGRPSNFYRGPALVAEWVDRPFEVGDLVKFAVAMPTYGATYTDGVMKIAEVYRKGGRSCDLVDLAYPAGQYGNNYCEQWKFRQSVDASDLVLYEPCPAQVAVEGTPLPEPFTHGDAIPAPPLTPHPGLFGSVTSATVEHAQSYEDQRLDAIAASTDIKAEIADEAKRIVGGARRSAYGKPEQNFERIARFWQAYFENTGRGDVKITARDVSPLMRLMKEARLAESPDHRDSFVDLVGYTLTGAEINGVKSSA